MESDRVNLASGVVDLSSGQLHGADGDIGRTPTEVTLLRYLVEARGSSVTRPELLQQVWGYAPGVRSRTIDTTIQRLRSKIEIDPKLPRHLVTVRGQGYALHALEGSPPAVRPPVLSPIPRLDRLVGRDGVSAAGAARRCPHRLRCRAGPGRGPPSPLLEGRPHEPSRPPREPRAAGGGAGRTFAVSLPSPAPMAPPVVRPGPIADDAWLHYARRPGFGDGVVFDATVSRSGVVERVGGDGSRRSRRLTPARLARLRGLLDCARQIPVFDRRWATDMPSTELTVRKDDGSWTWTWYEGDSRAPEVSLRRFRRQLEAALGL